MYSFRFPLWLTVAVTTLFFLCEVRAVSANDFTLNLTIEERDNEYFLLLKLRYVGKQHKILYVQTPTEAGKTILLTMFKKTKVKSITTTTYSQITYTGIVLDGATEHEFKLKCVAGEDGAIYCREIDQKLSLFEKMPNIAVQCMLYVSDFESKECNIIKVISNWQTIRFNHKVSDFPPPPAKKFDYSKLPPPP